MRTPFDVARFAASALVASAEVDGFCRNLFGNGLAVYLGGAGSDYETLPRPFAVVRLAAAEDGAKLADSVSVSVTVGIDSATDPATGLRADLTKPMPAPDGVLVVGRGCDLAQLVGLVTDEAADALPDCVVEKRSFVYRTGTTPIETAVCVLSVAPGIGFWNGEDAEILLNHPPQET